MAKALWYTTVSAPFGNIYIAGNDSTLEYIGLRPLSVRITHCDSIPLLQHTARTVEDYLSGNTHCVQAPRHLQLSPFQQEVFSVVKTIPYGHTATYSDIADALHKPHAVRAVMHTCLSNPLWLVFPAHRVVLSKDASIDNDRFWDVAFVLRSLEQRYLDKS